MRDNLLRYLVQAARKAYDNGDIAALPCVATNAKQRRLAKKYGTPLSFARGCIAAIGEISADEAFVAIRKYSAEWNAAGKTMGHSRQRGITR